MQRQRLSEDDILNWWLEKYHDTNITKIMGEHPDWKENPQDHSREFYEVYQVTQAQHDEWREWLVQALMKDFKRGRKYIERMMWAIYLNLSPMVLNEAKKTK